MRELYMEYDNIMIKKRKGFSNAYFNKKSSRCMEYALRVIKYAFNKYLRWTPEALERKLNKEIMVKMHLQPLMQYIDYPIEYDKNTDYYYLVSLLYKGHTLDSRARTIHTYESVLNGKIVKYPKDYFMGSDGLVRAAFCLQYMIEHFVTFHNANELYYFFASNEGYDALKKYRLLTVTKDAFETPVDFLHFSLPPEEKNDFFLNYYRFKFLKEMINDKGRKQKAINDYKLEV